MATSAELLGMAAGPSIHGDNPIITGADQEGGEGWYFPPQDTLTAAGACLGTPQTEGLIARGRADAIFLPDGEARSLGAGLGLTEAQRRRFLGF